VVLEEDFSERPVREPRCRADEPQSLALNEGHARAAVRQATAFCAWRAHAATSPRPCRWCGLRLVAGIADAAAARFGAVDIRHAEAALAVDLAWKAFSHITWRVSICRIAMVNKLQYCHG
jgi:hypothetical protein